MTAFASYVCRKRYRGNGVELFIGARLAPDELDPELLNKLVASQHLVGSVEAMKVRRNLVPKARQPNDESRVIGTCGACGGPTNYHGRHPKTPDAA
jgi:hypothetical protein